MDDRDRENDEAPDREQDEDEKDKAGLDEGQADLAGEGEEPGSGHEPEGGDEREAGEEESPGDYGRQEELTPENLETIAWESANTAKEILAFFPRVKTAQVTSRVEDGSVWVEMEGDSTGRLIGRKGKTIEAFQHILSKIMSHRLRRKITIHVDAEGYRKRYQIVHIALKQRQDVITASEGEDRNRFVVIWPRGDE